MSPERGSPEDPKKKPEQKVATDTGIVLKLIEHINEPCTDEAGRNLRDFYIKEAKRVLPTLTNLEAKKTLKEGIQKYSV